MLLFLIPVFISCVPVLLFAQSTLEGTVTYNGNPSKPLANVTITLQPGSLTTTTDATGFYQFTGLGPGSYTSTGTSSSPFSASNSIDALFILKHFVGIAPLYGLALLAGDVNGTGGTPNSVDALLVLKRWTGQITSFPAGDWRFQQFTLIIDGTSTYTQNINGLCMGDVSGDAY
ncbi:MAG: carboxypeptidase regulatory-like domain-containing protein [Bacteroidetes bacterium]|nr:carboxypeptidase regulatory-like domain-containing protein [Bacteroidota bacterium]